MYKSISIAPYKTGMGGEADMFLVIGLDKVGRGEALEGGGELLAKAVDRLIGTVFTEEALVHHASTLLVITFGNTAVSSLKKLHDKAEENLKRGIFKGDLRSANDDYVVGSPLNFAGDFDGEAALKAVAGELLFLRRRESDYNGAGRGFLQGGGEVDLKGVILGERGRVNVGLLQVDEDGLVGDLERGENRKATVGVAGHHIGKGEERF